MKVMLRLYNYSGNKNGGVVKLKRDIKVDSKEFIGFLQARFLGLGKWLAVLTCIKGKKKNKKGGKKK